jgi:hypothetical protein
MYFAAACLVQTIRIVTPDDPATFSLPVNVDGIR